jgi:zinc transport system substrate-binding protein
MLRKFLIILCLGLFSCQGIEKKTAKPLVVVSIPPYVSLIKKIAEKSVRVMSAISPGYNPHIAETTPREATLLQDASLWIGVGELYEIPLTRSLKEQNVLIVQMNENIEMEKQDLHFWLSLKKLKAQVVIMAKALSNLLPEMANRYQENKDRLLQEIDKLDKEVTALLKPFAGEAIVTSHASFGYFCNDYSLIQIAVEEEGKSPLPQHLAQVLVLAKKYNARCVFTQPQFDNKGALYLAKKLNLPHYSIDPLREDVLQNIKELAEKIAKGSHG